MTLPEFQNKQACVKGNDLVAKRDFICAAIQSEKPEYAFYCGYPGRFNIERDIKKCLGAFTEGGAADLHRLGEIRRFLYRRYAFCLAFKVEGQINNWVLWIDRLLPRLGLSLILGFAGVLGASDLLGWLTSLNTRGTAVFALGCWLLTLTAIFLNVRERVDGRCKSFARASWVCFLSLLWTTAYLAGAYWMGTYGGIDMCQFTLTKAINVGSAAIVIAVLAQFFFSRSGSIADPL